MAFPSTGILDNTTRANENPLTNGGTWGGPITSGHAQLQLVSNAVQVNSTAFSIGDEYWNPVTFGPSCECYATIAGYDAGNSGSVYFLYTNIQTPGAVAPVYYSFRFDLGNTGTIGNAQLSRNGPNGWSVFVGGLPSVSPAVVGDGFGLRVNGRTIEAWFFHAGAWTLVASANDALLSGVAALPAGYLGVGLAYPAISPAPVTWRAFGGGASSPTSSVFRLPLLGAG